MSEVLDVFVQTRSLVEIRGERLRGPRGTPRGKSPMPCCRENLLSEYRGRPYRNPTQVDNHQYGKMLEITLFKELGKIAS